MRILFLSPRLPLPADTGAKIRTWNLLKQINKLHLVDVLSFSFEANDQDYLKHFTNLGMKVMLVPLSEGSHVSKMATIVHAQPISVKKYFSPRMLTAIRALTAQQSYDVIHMDHIHMAQYFRLFQGKPCFVDEHNVEYRILERCADVEKSLLKKMAYRNQARKMQQCEKNVISHLSGCFAVSEDDSQLLGKLVHRKVPVHVIPNGVDTEFFRHDQKQGQSHEDALVYTGSMDWLPNDDAVIYFCKDVLPLILQLKPEIKFYIVGKNPSKVIKELASENPAIQVTGRVEDVRTFMNRAKVFVVPIRIGGGTRLKILEAMSMRMPVVSTTIGAEGIDYSEGENIIIADQPNQFAQSVINLLKDANQRISVGTAARTLVKERYDWSIVGEKLNTIYQGALHA